MTIQTRARMTLKLSLLTAVAATGCGARTDLDGHQTGTAEQAIVISQSGSGFMQPLQGTCMRPTSVVGGAFVTFATCNGIAQNWALRDVSGASGGGLGKYTRHQAVVSSNPGLCLQVGGNTQALLAGCIFGQSNQTFDISYGVISNGGRCMRDSGSTDVHGNHIYDFATDACTSPPVSSQIIGWGFDTIMQTVPDQIGIASAWADNNLGNSIVQRELQGVTVDGVAQPITTADEMQIFNGPLLGLTNGVVVGAKDFCTYNSCGRVITMGADGFSLTEAQWTVATGQILFFGRENEIGVGVDGYANFSLALTAPCVVAPGIDGNQLQLQGCAMPGPRVAKLEMRYKSNF